MCVTSRSVTGIAGESAQGAGENKAERTANTGLRGGLHRGGKGESQPFKFMSLSQ